MQFAFLCLVRLICVVFVFSLKAKRHAISARINYMKLKPLFTLILAEHRNELFIQWN